MAENLENTLMYKAMWEFLYNMIKNHPDTKSYGEFGEKNARIVYHLEGFCMEDWRMEEIPDANSAFIRLPYGGTLTMGGGDVLFINGYKPLNTDEKVAELEEELRDARRDLMKANDALSNIQAIANRHLGG